MLLSHRVVYIIRNTRVGEFRCLAKFKTEEKDLISGFMDWTSRIRDYPAKGLTTDCDNLAAVQGIASALGKGRKNT